MGPEARFDRFLDSFARTASFRRTAAGRSVAGGGPPRDAYGESGPARLENPPHRSTASPEGTDLGASGAPLGTLGVVVCETCRTIVVDAWDRHRKSWRITYLDPAIIRPSRETPTHYML